MCTGAHPFIPAPGIAKLQLIVLNNDQRTENVLHFHKETNWTHAQLVTLVESVIGHWAATLGAMTTANANLITIIADDMSSAAGWHYEVTPDVPIAGTNANDPMPNNVSFKLRFGTDKRGKSLRGGVYHTGLTKQGITQSHINVVTATMIKDAWVNFIGNLTSENACAHYIVSYCGGKAWRTTALINAVTSIDYADLTVDSQRRRLPGRGR